MSEDDYHGFTNYETWVIHNTIQNDAYLHAEYTQLVEEGITKDRLATRIKNHYMYCESVEELNNPHRDLLIGSLQEVNWKEIAEGFIED